MVGDWEFEAARLFEGDGESLPSGGGWRESLIVTSFLDVALEVNTSCEISWVLDLVQVIM